MSQGSRTWGWVGSCWDSTGGRGSLLGLEEAQVGPGLCLPCPLQLHRGCLGWELQQELAEHPWVTSRAGMSRVAGSKIFLGFSSSVPEQNPSLLGRWAVGQPGAGELLLCSLGSEPQLGMGASKDWTPREGMDT